MKHKERADMLFGVSLDIAPRILVLADSTANRDFLLAQLQTIRNPMDISVSPRLDEASELLRDRPHDLIVVALDSHRKDLLLDWVRERKQLVRQRLIPIVMMTSNHESSTRVRLIESGVDAVLLRPVPLEQFRAVIDTELERKWMTDQLEHVEQVVIGLVHTIDARDEHTAGHTQRVTRLSVQLADAMSLDQRRRGIVYAGALMHDIGKIGIPDAILKKSGGLTDDEFQIIKMHPVIGADILQPLRSLRPVLHVVRHHHERWDGRGYPDGLLGTDTALEARIVAVADSIDAMLSDRPYRPGLRPERVRDVLQANSGKQWDPDVVRLALEHNLVAAGATLLQDESLQDAFERPPRTVLPYPRSGEKRRIGAGLTD